MPSPVKSSSGSNTNPHAKNSISSSGIGSRRIRTWRRNKSEQGKEFSRLLGHGQVLAGQLDAFDGPVSHLSSEQRQVTCEGWEWRVCFKRKSHPTRHPKRRK